MTEYTYCGFNQPPLVHMGRWYDRTPCLDVKTDGLPGLHPFIGMVLLMDCVCVFVFVFVFVLCVCVCVCV